ncbi:MAG: N-acyl homoserine lactonase family protein [Lachnospiraceae bacterium]|jgi:N-acyl homoserine lactone hydrolase
MKLYVLDLGYQEEDKNFMVAGTNCATVHNPNPDFEWIRIPMQAFLIDHPEGGYILFDTGCAPDHEEAWPAFIKEQSPYTATEEQHLLPRLAALGVKPEDVKTVIMSHLHVDHAGCLSFFKNAEVYVHDDEFTNTICNYIKGEDINVHVPCDIERFMNAHLHWRTVTNEETEIEVAKGVTIVNFGSGHSWGMLGLRVDLENTGSLLLVADAIYMEENIYPELRLPGIIFDSQGYRRTIKFILEYVRKNNCKLIYGHDMQQFSTLKHSEDGYYD